MDTKRVLQLIGGQAAGAKLLGKPAQVVHNAASGKRALDQASQLVLANHGAQAAIKAYQLKSSPFVKAWVAHLLKGDSKVTLPRGFGRKQVTL